IYTLSLHDALPIWRSRAQRARASSSLRAHHEVGFDLGHRLAARRRECPGDMAERAQAIAARDGQLLPDDDARQAGPLRATAAIVDEEEGAVARRPRLDDLALDHDGLADVGREVREGRVVAERRLLLERFRLDREARHALQRDMNRSRREGGGA